MDGSPNSIPPELLATSREIVMVIDPMSREQIEAISEFKDLMKLLNAHHLSDPVWQVLGGSPQLYVKLKSIINESFLPSTTAAVADITKVVKNHLRSILSDALYKKIANGSLTSSQAIEIFRYKNVIKIPKMELKAMGLVLDYPNKVFREVMASDNCYIEPATAAVSLIISENVYDNVGINALMEKLIPQPEIR